MNSLDINGAWVNQNGSIVEFEVTADGKISGSYSSRKGRAASGLKYPISGQQNGELIVFHVNWQDDHANLHAITSFTGRCTNSEGCDAIHTLWVLARQFEDDAHAKPTGVWNTFLTNSDVFRREPVSS